MKRSGSDGNSASAPSPPSVGALARRWANRIPFDAGLAVVALLVLIAASPLFGPGLPSVADAPIHVFRTAEWVRNWQAGILIPRWPMAMATLYSSLPHHCRTCWQVLCTCLG